MHETAEIWRSRATVRTDRSRQTLQVVFVVELVAFLSAGDRSTSRIFDVETSDGEETAESFGQHHTHAMPAPTRRSYLPARPLMLTSRPRVGYVDTSGSLARKPNCRISLESYPGFPLATYPLHVMPQELIDQLLNTACCISRKFTLSLQRVSKWCRKLALPHLWSSVMVQSTATCSLFRTGISFGPSSDEGFPQACSYTQRLWFTGSGSQLLISDVLIRCQNLTHLAVTWDILQKLMSSAGANLNFNTRHRIQLRVTTVFKNPRLVPAPSVTFHRAVTHIYFGAGNLSTPCLIADFPNVTHLAFGASQAGPPRQSTRRILPTYLFCTWGAAQNVGDCTILRVLAWDGLPSAVARRYQKGLPQCLLLQVLVGALVGGAAGRLD